MFFENLRIALRAIGANKMRSVLTVLGVMIGVAAVIAVVSLVQGMQHQISGQLENIGGTFIRVVPDFSKSRGGFLPIPQLTYEDSVAIQRSATAVTAVTPIFFSNASLKYGDTRHDTSLYAVNQLYPDIAHQYVDRGRFFGTIDEEAKKRVCVLGPEAVRSLALDDPIGKEIRLGNDNFTVIGVMEKRGASLGNDPDDVVYIPFATAYLLYGADQMKHLPILLQVRTRDDIDLAKEQVREVLRAQHHIKKDDPDDFQVTSQEELMKTISTVLNTTSAVMGGIVGIALLVGGIGIMNIMLVSVNERTREIGIRKAVGARRTDILTQFLIEAVALTGLGGIIGILLGWAITEVVHRIPQAASLPLLITTGTVVIAVGVSVAIGVVFGLYPAMRAARLHPIQALRYE
ncbi:MAG TPA: ABC transporter permease [Thermoanaerobaculia bacterium]|nr:ABC transporter permease [Thermoanaerobaculia bacterium]